MATNDAICKREIKFSYAMVKAALNKKMTLFTSKLDLNLGKHLKDLLQLKLRRVDQKYLESSKMRCWRGMEKISWTDRLKIYIISTSRRKYTSYIHATSKAGSLNGSVTSCVETAL